MNLTFMPSLSLGLIVLITWKLVCEGVPVEEDLTLSQAEKTALDKFRLIVEKYLYDDYMKKDIYLIKWLRAKDLDIDEARNMLLSNLEWRREYGMDTILNEDFTRYENEYPINMDAWDYTGRPVTTIDITNWDVRRVILSGQKEAVIRYIYRQTEIGIRRIREAQDKGKLVTQSVVIVNLKGFNLIQHACVQCIPIYLNLILAFENRYPQLLHKLIGINTPSSFEVLLQALKPATSKATQDALELYGNNRREWEPVISSLVSPDQIGTQYGGTIHEFI